MGSGGAFDSPPAQRPCQATALPRLRRETGLRTIPPLTLHLFTTRGRVPASPSPQWARP